MSDQWQWPRRSTGDDGGPTDGGDKEPVGAASVLAPPNGMGARGFARTGNFVPRGQQMAPPPPIEGPVLPNAASEALALLQTLQRKYTSHRCNCSRR